jgi:putative membrane protein
MVEDFPLNDAERLRIRDAIAAAESQTIGEIFVVVARESDDYRPIPILWATLIALAVPLPLIAYDLLARWDTGAVEFGILSAPWIYLIQLCVFIVLALVLSIPAVKLLVVPRRVKLARAHGLAVEQFLAHGLHTTEARTGVLIFVSLAERYAELIADAGIAKKVEQAVWDEAMAALIAEIKAKRLAEGLIAAIERSGAVLAQHFPPRPRDRNELPNDLVIL